VSYPSSPRFAEQITPLLKQLYSPNVQSKGTAGDHAADLVSRVIKKLLVRPFYTESEGRVLVDAIVDSTLQYTLPTLGRCCEYNPFCGVLDQDKGCQSESVEGAGEGVKKFSRASERGEFRSARAGYLYPGFVLPYQVLEDPGRASLKAGGLVGVRKLAWEILDEVLGLRFEAEPQPESDLELEGAVEESSMMMDMTVGESGDEGLDKDTMKTENGSQSTLVNDDTTKGGESNVQDLDLPKTDTDIDIEVELQSNNRANNRTVTEYIRSSNRITPHTITLDPPTSSIRALASLQDRLQTYLTPFNANTTLITALPTHFQPIVAILRFCVLDSINWPGHEQSWRLPEIEGVLKACLGTYAQWERERAGDVPSKKELEMSYPNLSGRNAQLVAHLQATMTDSILLAEALLLSNSNSNSNSNSDPDSDSNEDAGDGSKLTHLEIYKFYSGQTIHTFLNKEIPEVWKWRESDQTNYEQCWNTLIDGIQDKIVGYTPSPTATIPITSEGEKVEEVVEEKVEGKKRKKSKSKGKNEGGGGGKNQKSSSGSGGRFDLLNGLMD
jgi:hypothetical protein